MQSLARTIRLCPVVIAITDGGSRRCQTDDMCRPVISAALVLILSAPALCAPALTATWKATNVERARRVAQHSADHHCCHSKLTNVPAFLSPPLPSMPCGGEHACCLGPGTTPSLPPASVPPHATFPPAAEANSPKQEKARNPLWLLPRIAQTYSGFATVLRI
jgi:hypothetical protein